MISKLPFCLGVFIFLLTSWSFALEPKAQPPIYEPFQQFRSPWRIYPQWRMDRSRWSCLVLRPGSFSMPINRRLGFRSVVHVQTSIQRIVVGCDPNAGHRTSSGRMLGSDTRSNRDAGRSARHPCEGCPSHTEALNDNITSSASASRHPIRCAMTGYGPKRRFAAAQ